MKTKLFTLFIVTCTLLIAFTACDNGNGKNEPPTFTVTFHANGGTPEPQPQTIAQGGKAAEPQVTKPNNTLDGWYTQAAFTAQWNFAADTVTADIDLYAKWTEQPILRSQVIALNFGGTNYSATVEGTLLSAEWNGVAGKVKNVLEAGYGATFPVLQGGIRTYFDNNEVVIIVQNTTEYAKYKTDKTEPAVMYLNLGALDGGMTSAEASIAISYMRNSSSGSAKATVRDAIRMAKAPIDALDSIYHFLLINLTAGKTAKEYLV